MPGLLTRVEAVALAGAGDDAAIGFCASGKDFSSCIVRLIAAAAGLAEVGRPDAPAFELIGEAASSRFTTRTVAVG